MKKILLLFFLVSICGVMQVMAQALTITGKVTTSDDGSALPGATVKIKGTSNAVSTDVNGTYSIKASAGQVLIYSFIGNLPAERTVGSQTVINVALKTDNTSLQEVVVTGFGIKQEKRDLTSSTQTITGASIAQTQRENLVNSLQGRIAGATVTSTSGVPGASASIVLRGITSIGGNNQPLFVVDGIRVNNDALSQGALASNGDNRREDFTNRIADINPDDIENVTVLKGADAAAVYGSDAAGGAIVITTKKGKSGPGSITYNNNFSFSKEYRFPKIQTTFGPGTNGYTDPTTRLAFGPAYAPGTQTYNNLQNFFQTGVSQLHDLAFAGGNDSTASYRISGEYRHSGGVIPVVYNNKLSLRFAGQAKITPKLTSSATFNYFNLDNRKTNKGDGGTYINALSWPTNDDVRNYLNPDGSRRTLLPANLANIVSDASIDYDNPFWDVHNNISRDKTNRMIGNFDLSYDPIKWLNLRGLFGVDFYTTQGNNLVSQYSNSYQNAISNSFQSTSGINRGGIIDNYDDNNILLNGSFFATAKHNFGDFRATLAVGAEIYDSKDVTNGQYGEAFLQPDFNTINNTTPTTQRATTSYQETRRIGEIARLSVVYKELLTFNATGRNDYSSRLAGTTKDSYFYPSAGVGFNFTELPALKGNKILSFGKIRFSYAGVGKDPFAPYRILSSVIQQSTTGGGYAYDVTGNNPYLKPEKDYQMELGTELQFFNGRLGAEINVYKYRATNQIFDPRISYASGYILELVNGGEIQNKGVEVELTGTVIKSKDFSWKPFANFFLNRGKVINLGNLPEYYNSDTWLYANARASIFPGSSLSNIASYSYLRNNAGQILVDPTTGMPISNSTFVTVGDRQPKFTLGLGNNFTYKSFALSFLLDWRHGGDVFNGNELFLTRYGLSTRTTNRQTSIVIPGVLKDGNENSATPTTNTIQINPYYQQGYYTNAIESDFVEHNISSLRLRDITLSYTLPASLLAKQKVFKSFGVYVTATDLFLITNYTGADPEVNGTNSSTRGSGAAGFDYGTIATPRTISFGVSAKL